MVSYIKEVMHAKGIWKHELETNFCAKIYEMAREEGFTMKNIIVCGIHLKSRRLRWVSRVDEYRTAYKIVTVKPTEKRPLRRSRHK